MNKNLSLLLSKLVDTNFEKTTENILHTYETKKKCLVHFLYFATLVLNKLDQETFDATQKNFVHAWEMADFLLPDGIALRILCKKYLNKDLPNLNWTDFVPYFLSHIPHDQQVDIILYGWTEEVLKKSAAYVVSTFGHRVIYAQHGFQEFDWSHISKKTEGTIRILLVGRGSPRQEIWTENNRSQIESMECLVFTVGGLLDFWSWAEKRAPAWMRTMKIEWLYRALSNPKKNLKKTLVSLKLMKFLIQK